jgi:hypothetical protein
VNGCSRIDKLKNEDIKMDLDIFPQGKAVEYRTKWKKRLDITLEEDEI